jgi:hypothetical protein
LLIPLVEIYRGLSLIGASSGLRSVFASLFAYFLHIIAHCSTLTLTVLGLFGSTLAQSFGTFHALKIP